MKKTKPKKKAGGDSRAVRGANRELKTVALSCLTGVCVTFVILAVVALVMTFTDLPHGAITPITIAAVVAGCFAAGFFCGKALREKGLLYGFICGSILFLLAFFSELLLVGDKISVLLLYKYIIYIASAMIGDVLGVNRRRKVH